MRFLIFIITLLLLNACKSLSTLSPATYPIEPIQRDEYQKLNGVYKNEWDTGFGKIKYAPYTGYPIRNPLADILFIYTPPNTNCETETVNIKFISKKNAIVNIYYNDSLIVSKKLKGKLKEGYFIVRPRVQIIPFFPIFYYHNFERLRIAKSENNLLIDHTIRLWAFSLFSGWWWDNGKETAIYKKVETQK